MPILQINKDGVLLQELEIQAECITIGRDASSDIRLGDLTVSRQHGQLRRAAGGRYYVENLQSHNGIRLNGHEISQPTALTDGDQLKVGVYQLLFRHAPEMNRQPSNQLHAHAGKALLEVFGAIPKSPASEALPVVSQPTKIQPVEEKNAASPTPQPRAVELEVGILINEANNAIFTLDHENIVLGNDGQVDIRIPGPERMRATIARRGEYFYLCSETPVPCAFVNGRPVMNARLLYNDRIEIGGRRFIFREI
jgi:hypothetical protein